MKLIYQTEDDNCMQTGIASLFDLDITLVPNFIKYSDAWGKLIYYIYYLGYNYDGCLYNYKCCNGNKDDFKRLKDFEGVDGYFLATVHSPKKDGVSHMIIIDKEYNIVNSIKEEYKSIKFPQADKIGYHGIKQILLINPKPLEEDV